MLVYGRGLPNPVEVPDQPAASGTAPIGRADTQADHATANVVPSLDSGSPVQWFAHSDPLQFTPVASVVTDLQAPSAVVRGDLGGSPGFGDGDIGRGESIAPLALNASDYSDHGWFIVPSASNEYGDAQVAADGFAFDVAAGEFAADWFLA